MTVVAVTGATGFLGSSLIRALDTREVEITAFARPTSNREPLSDLNIRWVEGDVKDPASLAALTRGRRSRGRAPTTRAASRVQQQRLRRPGSRAG